MRVLLPDGPSATDADVHAHYAAGWAEHGGVRVNFVSAADGAVAAAGRSRGLQTPGDNRVFTALRDLADVVLVGSGTAVAEAYGAARFDEARQAARQRYGFAPQLPIAVLSRSLNLDPSSKLFRDAAPGARTVVLTCTSADPDRRRALTEVADVLDCGETTVEPDLARSALTDRGLRRILCEGGPSVFATFAAAGSVDELCLSITPLLGGPGSGRITAGPPWPDSVGLRLSGLLEEDGALFCRYAVARPAD